MPTVTNVTVVSSLYDIVGNSGRKVVMLSNRWLIASAFTAGKLYFYRSTDDGSTWSQLCYFNTSSSMAFALCSYETTVYCVAHNESNSTVAFLLKFDATIVSGEVSVSKNIDINQTGTFAQDSISLAINPSNGHLTAAWASKNSNYPNTFNIRSAKSTDGGATWTKQDGTAGVDQITTENTVNRNYFNPTVTYMGNGNPIIICEFNFGNKITPRIWNGSSWSGVTDVHGDATYAQIYPCVIADPGGRLWCVWAGMDASSGGAGFQIRIKYSDDNGATWANGGITNEKLTNLGTKPQIYPTLSANKAGDIFVVWHGYTNEYPNSSNLYRQKWSGAWGAKDQLTFFNTGGHDAFHANSVYNTKLSFTDPPTIFSDTNAPAVKFRGTWSIAPAVWANIGGVWKSAESVHVNIGGTWKEVESLGANIGGVWKDA